MSPLDSLLSDLFDGRQTPLAREFEGWLRDSRRYLAFATTYKTKIRAKLRNARDDDDRMAVRAELEAAALLLREQRFTVEYEKYAAAKQRGPDFTVTWKGHTPFNVEVRRLRDHDLTDLPGPVRSDPTEARAARLMAVLLDKVRQMPPGIANVLWLAAEAEVAEGELAQAALALRQLAERTDDAFFARRGFEGAADYLRQSARLSAVVSHRPAGGALWLNPLARHRLPSELAAALRRLSREPA